MVKKVVTKARVKNSLQTQFKEFLDGENIPEQITKKIEEHSIQKGLVKEVYHYLDTSLVELENGKTVEAYHLHRTLGNIIDLFTPIGEQVISETKNEPCILPRYQLKCLVAEVGSDEYVLLGFYNPNMVGSFSPAENGHYLIKTMNDGFQAGLDIFSDNINIDSYQGASFIQTNADGDKEINYADSDNVYRKAEVYNKLQTDLLLKEIWDYIHEHCPDEED